MIMVERLLYLFITNVDRQDSTHRRTRQDTQKHNTHLLWFYTQTQNRHALTKDTQNQNTHPLISGAMKDQLLLLSSHTCFYQTHMIRQKPENPKLTLLETAKY